MEGLESQGRFTLVRVREHRMEEIGKKKSEGKLM